MSPMIARCPTTIIDLGGVIYMVTLDKRLGMPTQETYDAEIQRIIEMAQAKGIAPTVSVYKQGDTIKPPRG
jgi:hypothetical protein